MDLVWAIAFHIKPIMVLPSSSYNSFVLYYGIATYLAAHHSYPIRSSMGMIWLSPIPIPHDVWPSTMGMLCIWQYSTQFPYHPGTLVYDMGMIWEWYGNLVKSHTIPISSRHAGLWHGNDMVNFHTISISSAGTLHLIREWYGFSPNSCPIPYFQWTAVMLPTTGRHSVNLLVSFLR